MELDLERQRSRLHVRLNKYLAMARNVGPGEIDPRKAFKFRLSLPAVRRALKKLNDGTYGLCEDCEEPVSEERLIAIPAAERCVACQERKERDNALRA